MNEMVVLAAGFADDARISSVFSRGYTLGDLAVERAEDGGTAGVVETGELRVGEDDVCDGLGVTRDELNDIGR